MPQVPAIFVSHGAPDLPLRSGAAPDFLKQLGRTLPKPQAILVISAHWSTQQPTVSFATNPRTIHDFYGFPAALHQLDYPAPGAIELTQRVVELLSEKAIGCHQSMDYGLDHGAWTPLMPLFVAMGAAGNHARGTQIHSSFTYGELSMAAYQWTVDTDS
jgi:4,5-DOPA dioxygenase extradiol